MRRPAPCSGASPRRPTRRSPARRRSRPLAPVADPSRLAIYAAASDGKIRKLRVSDGKVLWTTSVTRDPTHEKLTSSLNYSKGLVLVTTGGYIGDAPPYQGHVVSLFAASGRIDHVWNSLCSDRPAIITPSTCSASDSAIWSRNGAAVDPATGDLVVATGNATFNGSTDWGDSVLVLSPDASKLLRHWTPADQDHLNTSDLDLGSTSPALLPGGYGVQGGKDGLLRLLPLNKLPGVNARTGGEVQTLPTPGNAALFTEPAVWQGKWVFVADPSGTEALRFAGGRLKPGGRTPPAARRRSCPEGCSTSLVRTRSRCTRRRPASCSRRSRTAAATGRPPSRSTAESRSPRAIRTRTRRAACSTSTRSRSREDKPAGHSVRRGQRRVEQRCLAPVFALQRRMFTAVPGTSCSPSAQVCTAVPGTSSSLTQTRPNGGARHQQFALRRRVPTAVPGTGDVLPRPGGTAVPGTGVVASAGSLRKVLAHLLRRRTRVATLLVLLAVVGLPAAASGRTQTLHLVHVAHVTDPLYATAPAGQPGKLYVVLQAGQIVVLTNGKLTSTFLDIHSLVKSGGELGLLSMAFDPGYAKNHRFYVDYTDVHGDTRVVRYLSNGTTGIPSSAKQLLFVKDFAPNHNGGQLQFGPDGRLYWGNGDGGGEDDPNDNGQNLNRPFAKIMRLNVNAATPRWQLVAYGLRNPWRFSFDRKTGDLYIGDVGQNKYEEIDYLPRGFQGIVNFGWKHFEGNHIFDAGVPLLTTGHYVAPIVEYSHDNGNCAVDGGFVYRGANVAAAVGRYFYGDNCSGTVWSLKVVNGKATDVRVEPFKVPGLSGFGQDSRGELYLLSVSTGDIFRLAG